MVKLKNRYILAEVFYEDEGGAVTDSAIYAALCKQIAALFGDFGIAAAKSSLSVKVFDSATATSVIRISVESSQRLLASIPFVNSIGGIPAVLKVLFVGCSIRSCEKALLRINRMRLYSSLKSATNKSEEKELLDAIRATTGNVRFE
uniref:Ribonuclease P/MRP protein subunit POP5 n=1 Tax=Parascaris univalens TaxID=6257 RepID=A0A915AZM2_PARUN